MFQSGSGIGAVGAARFLSVGVGMVVCVRARRWGWPGFPERGKFR